jgi:RNA recognition motif-containing protein
MNLDRAFILLFASIGAVTGFTPSCRSTFSVSSSQSLSNNVVAFAPRRVISSLFSEVEHATETAPSAAKSGFETAIYVGNISFDTSESDIMAAFASHGVVSKVQVPTDRETVSKSLSPTEFMFHLNIFYMILTYLACSCLSSQGRARGFAFVTMSSAEEHAAAIAALDQSEMGGRTIYVSESLPKDKIADKKKRDSPKKRK